MHFLPHFWVKIGSKMGKMHRLYHNTSVFLYCLARARKKIEDQKIIKSLCFHDIIHNMAFDFVYMVILQVCSGSAKFTEKERAKNCISIILE
jgi:hypothetical protein